MAWKDVIKRWLLKRGIILSRPPGQFSAGEIRLRNARRLGLHVGSIIDGGAARGEFARLIKNVYPEARVLCIEPREDTQPQLVALRERLSGIEIAKVLLGDKDGQTEFYEHADQSSMLREMVPEVKAVRTVPVRTLDGLVKERNFPTPDLIKLDLQGAEMLALQGGRQCLQNATAILLELSFLEFQQGLPTFADMVAFMKAQGFVIYDTLAIWQRPLDWALAQGDFLFIKEASPLRADRRFFAGDE